ncbi:MAG: asparagine synthase (glutamine-hydrolyzing), partial [Nitrospiria bacterium]
MSGIVGIWNLKDQPVEKPLLQHLSATLAHRGSDGEGIWSRGSVGLACQNLWVTLESEKEIQPKVHS